MVVIMALQLSSSDVSSWMWFLSSSLTARTLAWQASKQVCKTLYFPLSLKFRCRGSLPLHDHLLIKIVFLTPIISHTHTHTHTHAHTHTHTHTHIHTHTHTHTHSHTRAHTHTHTHIHTDWRTCTHSGARTHTHTHTEIH